METQSGDRLDALMDADIGFMPLKNVARDGISRSSACPTRRGTPRITVAESLQRWSSSKLNGRKARHEFKTSSVRS